MQTKTKKHAIKERIIAKMRREDEEFLEVINAVQKNKLSDFINKSLENINTCLSHNDTRMSNMFNQTSADLVSRPNRKY